MIKFTRAEKENDLKFKDVEIVDISTNSVTFKTTSGETFRIDAEYSTIRVLIPAKPKMVKKYQLAGSFNGLSIQETFDSEYEAICKRDAFPFEIRESFKTTEIQVEER